MPEGRTSQLYLVEFLFYNSAINNVTHWTGPRKYSVWGNLTCTLFQKNNISLPITPQFGVMTIPPPPKKRGFILKSYIGTQGWIQEFWKGAPKMRQKRKSECQISVFLVSGTKIQGFRSIVICKIFNEKYLSLQE